MKFKKAQLSAFIILVVILLAIIAIYFVIKSDLGESKVNPEIQPVYSSIESCLKQTADEAVYYIGQTGGYFVSPNLSTENQVAYYYDKGRVYLPSLDKIENELNSYMNSMLFFCIEGFIEFPDLDIKQGEIKSKVKISDEGVVFEVDYPITISKGENTYRFDKFENIEVPVRLRTIYDVAIKVIDEETSNGDFCINCIDDIMEEHDLYLEMWDYDEETVVFNLVDFNSQINGKEYKFYFASKYELE